MPPDALAPGARVHLRGLGTGTVIEARGPNRYAIQIKSRIVVASARDLEPASPTHAPRPPARPREAQSPPARVPAASSIDLHGQTTAEAIEAVERFINDALLAGHAQVRIVHGRGGGKLKAAVHGFLRRLACVAAFRLEPDNPGVTVVTFR